MTCYTVTTCVISGGSIPSDKGGGGIHPDPESWDKGGGVGRPRPYLRIGHCYIVTLGSLSSSRFQARWASIGPRHWVFFPFGFPSTSMELQHAGKKTQMKKKLNRPFVFKCSIKVKLGRFALYSWSAGKEIFFSRARYARAVLLFCWSKVTSTLIRIFLKPYIFFHSNGSVRLPETSEFAHGNPIFWNRFPDKLKAPFIRMWQKNKCRNRLHGT